MAEAECRMPADHATNDDGMTQGMGRGEKRRQLVTNCMTLQGYRKNP